MKLCIYLPVHSVREEEPIRSVVKSSGQISQDPCLLEDWKVP